MSLNLVGFIKNLIPSFTKSDVESDMEISLEAIVAVNDVYSQLEEVCKVTPLVAIENTSLIKEFYKEINSTKHKVKLSHNKSFPLDILTLFKNIKLNGDYVLKEISDSVNDIVVSQALTAYKANLLRASAHYYFLTKFAMDLANFFYTNEVSNGGLDVDKEYLLNKKQKEFITKNMWLFARMVVVYGEEPDVFKDKISKIDEINLPKEEVENVVDVYNIDKIDIFSNLPSNFIGSPIYSVRLIFAQWEADRYKKLRDQKKLLELRYLHLKLIKDQGDGDSGLEKEIAYLQKRITNVDYQMSKIEESVE